MHQNYSVFKNSWIVLLLLISSLSFAQTNTWDGSASTNWNTAANWSLNEVPTATHDVVIPNGVTGKITVNTTAVCKTFTMLPGNSANTVTISGTSSLTVSGAVLINSGNGNGDNKILAVGAGTLTAESITMEDTGNDNRDNILSLSSGTISVFRDIIMNGSKNRNQVTFTAAGTLNIGGTMTGGGLTPANGTVNYNNLGDQAVGVYGYNNLTISGSGNKNSSIGAFSVNNNLNVTQGNLILTAVDADYVVNNDLIVSTAGKLSHNVYWDGTGKKLLVNGNLSIDGQFSYNVRSHIQMGTGGKTIKTGAAELCILTMAHTTGTITANGSVNVNDNFWPSFNVSGGTFATGNNTITAKSGVLVAGGTMLINGGTVNVAGGLQIGVDLATNGGIVNFDSGTLNTDAINIGNGQRAGVFNHKGGTANIGNLNINAVGANVYACSTVGPQIINITGTWSNNKTFTSGSNSTVNFLGTSAQTLTGILSGTNGKFYNLIFNGAGATNNSPMDVSGTLTMTKGLLTTSNTNILNITNTAATAATAGNSESYINGPVKWTTSLNAVYTFPLGKGTTYLPFVLKTGSTAATPSQVEAFDANAGGSPIFSIPTTSTTLGSLSDTEYWSLLSGGNYTNSSISVSRPTDISPFDAIGGSATKTGVYSSLGGTVGANGISNSTLIGTNRFFTFAQKNGIRTGTIVGSPFCAGSTVTIPYTVTGTYGTGNVFTAQLSDASGSFASPTTLATVSQTAANIIATIPANAIAGTAYRIRVVSTNPKVLGKDNGSNLIINTNLPASVSIAANPGTTICAGTSVTFTATPTNGGTAPGYQWKVNNVNAGTNSATFTTTTLANGDKVTVVLTSNASPCSTGSPAISNEVVMTVNPTLPASISIAANPGTTICAGTSVTFTATPTNGGTTPGYQWKVNGTEVLGETASTFTTSTLANNDKVTVVMTSNASPCLIGSPATSNQLTMNVNPLPTTVTVSGNGQVCSGVDAVFTIAGTAGTIVTYNINGGSNTVITVPDAGSVVVKVSPATADQVLSIVSVSNGTCSNYTTSVTTVTVGAVSTYKDGEWSKGLPNNNGLSASIESDYQTGSGSIKACNCTVKSGVILTISPNTEMEVLNNISNNGTIVVESDGNLNQISDNAVNEGAIYVRRKHILTVLRKEYNFLSSPVKSQNMRLIFGNNALYVPFVTVLNEKTNAFVNAIADDYNKPARGFSVKEPTTDYKAYEIDEIGEVSSKEALYKGVPNNGNIGIAVTKSAGNRGWNVIGNPYPSNLDLQLLYQDNSDKITPEFRFWDNKVNATYTQFFGSYNGYSYALYNALTGVNGFGNVAPGKDGGENTEGGTVVGNKKSFKIVKVSQAFMVRATDTPGVINYKNSYRSTSQTNTNFYGKNSQSEESSFRIQLVTPDKLVLTQGVVYFEGGNNSFGLEDSKHPAPSSSDAFYSFVDDNKVIINGRSIFDKNDVIKLGTQNYSAGIYKIRAIDQQGIFENGQHIYVKDNLIDTVFDLSENDYEFTSTSGTFTNRFEIVYEPQNVLVASGTVKADVQIYRDAQDFVIKSSLKKINSFDLFDMSGRIIFGQKTKAKEVRFNASKLVDGNYILKANLEGGDNIVKKIRK